MFKPFTTVFNFVMHNGCNIAVTVSIVFVDVGLVVVMPCGLVGRYQHFRGIYCLHL
jgi:hypothetical protein